MPQRTLRRCGHVGVKDKAWPHFYCVSAARPALLVPHRKQSRFHNSVFLRGRRVGPVMVGGVRHTLSASDLSRRAPGWTANQDRAALCNIADPGKPHSISYNLTCFTPDDHSPISRLWSIVAFMSNAEKLPWVRKIHVIP